MGGKEFQKQCARRTFPQQIGKWANDNVLPGIPSLPPPSCRAGQGRNKEFGSMNVMGTLVCTVTWTENRMEGAAGSISESGE